MKIIENFRSKFKIWYVCSELLKHVSFSYSHFNLTWTAQRNLVKLITFSLNNMKKMISLKLGSLDEVRLWIEIHMQLFTCKIHSFHQNSVSEKETRRILAKYQRAFSANNNFSICTRTVKHRPVDREQLSNFTRQSQHKFLLITNSKTPRWKLGNFEIPDCM